MDHGGRQDRADAERGHHRSDAKCGQVGVGLTPEIEAFQLRRIVCFLRARTSEAAVRTTGVAKPITGIASSPARASSMDRSRTGTIFNIALTIGRTSTAFGPWPFCLSCFTTPAWAFQAALSAWTPSSSFRDT